MENPSQITIEQPLIPSEQAVRPAPTRQVKLFKGQVILNPTIKGYNFFSFMVYALYMGVILIPINLLQAPLLSITYGLTPAASANANTIVQICQLVFQLILAPWLGFICDKYSRKILIIAGVIAVTSSTVLLPNLPSIYPFYVLVLLLQCFGFLCLNIPPILADYIDYETKGRVSGIVSVLGACGGYLSTLLEQQGDLKSTINDKFYEFGAITLVLGLIISFGLKGGQYHKKLRHDLKAEDAKKSLRASGVEVYDASQDDELIENLDVSYSAERNGAIVAKDVIKLPESDEESTIANTIDIEPSRNIAYIETSLNNEVSLNNQIEVRSPSTNRNRPLGSARGSVRQSVRGSQGIVEEETAGLMIGLQEAKNPWILIGYLCGFLYFSSSNLLGYVFVTYVVSMTGDEGSASQSYALTNKQMLVGIVCSVVFGFCADKYDKFNQIAFCMLCSGASVVMIILMPSPYHPMAYVAMVWSGIANSGLVVFVAQLLSKYATPKYRASVNAVGTMFIIFGGAMVNIVGVFISQYNPLYPFFLYLGFLVIGFALLAYVYITKKEIIKNL